MHRLVVLAALVVGLGGGCKKKAPPGLPPAAEWKTTAEPATPPADQQAPTNPHPEEPAGPPGPGPGPGPMTAQKTPPKALDQRADGRSVLGPFTLVVPKEWTVKPVTSSMRAADFILSDKPGLEAELVVYYFGPSGAGSVEDNLDRWVGQFQQANGKPSKDVAKLEKLKLAGQDATIVSVTGRYVAEAMPGATETVDKQDQSLLAAIISSPSGPYYFKLVGAK
jgi:hypothetical protein